MISNPDDDESTVGGSMLYGLCYGALFGLLCSGLSLWSGAGKQFPAWELILGFGGFTLVCAVACALVGGVSCYVSKWWRLHSACSESVLMWFKTRR